MNRNAVEWEHNKIQLRSAFCMYFLYHRCRERPTSSIVNSFVNDKLCNDQLVYAFVRRKYRQIHSSLKQNINFVVKQMSRALYREVRKMLCVFSLFIYSLYDIQIVKLLYIHFASAPNLQIVIYNLHYTLRV